MSLFCKAIGDPQNALKMIHVAGTKGKGSVSAMLASIFQANGYCVGLYTSPHLQEFTERIQINGIEITKDEFCELIDSISADIDRLDRISTFEIATAAAILYFKNRAVDLAIIEVGLGGRLDATNIITPELSVITSISHDHTAILGKTLSEIAREKAGIIKPGIPVISASKNKDVNRNILSIASINKSKLYLLDDHIKYKVCSKTINYQKILLFSQIGGTNQISNPSERIDIQLPLVGPHQARNAAAAYLAIKIMQERGWKLLKPFIESGFQHVHWPARFEVISQSPQVIIDCAHNVDSMRYLVRTVKANLKINDVIWLFGVSEDKDIMGMFKVLRRATKVIHLTKSTHPRAASVQKLESLARVVFDDINTYESIDEAFSKISSHMTTGQTLLCTGSIFLASAVRAILKGSPASHEK
jgi:dihydrofolate synthase / folylpolyglutamate synthase